MPYRNVQIALNSYADATQYLSAMLQQGKLNFRENIVRGLESAPSALEAFYTGANMGKTIIEPVADDTDVANNAAKKDALS